MTRRLRRYNHHLSVQLLGNRAVSLTVDEQALVAVSAPVGMCREVILHGDGGPAILGWTLFAEAALQGAVCRIWESSRWESAFSVMHRRGGITCNWPVSR